MSDEAPSSSSDVPEASSSSQAPFVTHQVTKLDTMAGLAIRYGVSVADIKRANGLLSDSAMFAKDKLLIPTQAMPPMGVEYCTWAGMIVTQYGRFPGSHAVNGVLYNGAQGGSPPRQSAALDQLQRYYGTGDTCSEPGDFKPGSAAAGLERLARLGRLSMGRSDNVEIEMTELEHEQGACHSPSAGVLRTSEYAGSREGRTVDERLRRRKGLEDSEISPSSNGHLGDGTPQPSGSGPGRPRPPVMPTQVPTFSAGNSPAPGSRRQSIMDRVKRAASQPTLSGLPQALGVPQIVKAAEALVARVDTSAGPASAPARSTSREMPPLQGPSAQPSPGSSGMRRVPSSSGIAPRPPLKKD
ncbi:g6229 [Coccomyxa viridis]|uniref:G6229 protein n=1 Tax=Coccomyxa viridis TaxID=1274662 RepID=A0ABP1FZR2_9CHLO